MSDVRRYTVTQLIEALRALPDQDAPVEVSMNWEYQSDVFCLWVGDDGAVILDDTGPVD